MTILSSISDSLTDSPVAYKISDYLAGRPTESRSPLWPKTRRAYIALFPTCAICGCKTSLNVHHIKPFHLFPTLELDPTNFITLGERCPSGNHHFMFGHFLDWTKWNPDVVALATFFWANIRQQRADFAPTRFAA